MTEKDSLTVLGREGLDWVDRITSGMATESDMRALLTWRDQSDAHSQALHEAVSLRRKCRQLGQVRGTEKSVSVVRFLRPEAGKLNRRILITGGIAASVAGYAVVRPPFDLWPSWAEIMADYRTPKGGRQEIAFAQGISVLLNTQTSLAKGAAGGPPVLKLLHGEVAVTAQLPEKAAFALTAAGGQVVASQAQYNVRFDGADVCVTCIAGHARIEASGAVSSLNAGQQIVYGAGGMQPAVPVDADRVTAWRYGNLVLREALLGDAIAEINRYRTGAIMIGSPALRKRRINAVLQIAEMEKVVPLICRLTGAQASSLGGYVLLT